VPLSEFLEGKVTARLLALEVEGRANVRDRLLAMLNPASTEASAEGAKANARVTEIANELSTRKLFPWIHPFLSALAFESIGAACVHAWLAAGEPKAGVTLVPAVREYVRWQVAAFSAAVGAGL
jgi:hypothetical protein